MLFLVVAVISRICQKLLKYLKPGDYWGVCVTIRLHDTLKMTGYFYDVMTKQRIHGRIVI
ncbi:hypothetical protein [Globicatella sanguinis]